MTLALKADAGRENAAAETGTGEPAVAAANAAGHVAAGPFAVTRLSVVNFRNYAACTIQPSARLVVLAGDNGAGKTNLMEAVSLLGSGRGLRHAPAGDIARIGQQPGGVQDGAQAGWSVHGHVRDRNAVTEIATGLAAAGTDAGTTTRKVRIDGRVKGPGALDDHVRIMWLTPAQDRLFSGPAGDRRRYFDRLAAVITPDHRRRLNAYEKAMRERNRLLSMPSADDGWLSGLETQMAEHGVAIAAGRRDFASLLDAAIAAMAPDLAALSFPHGALSFTGEWDALMDRHKAVVAEDICRKMLHDSRKLDGHAGRTLSGIHKSDVEVVHGGKGMAAGLCSTGERKALLISLVLAHARAVAGLMGGAGPVMLLDEVAAHLDPVRRDGLLHYLPTLPGQVWMTGTSADLFAAAAEEAEIYTVDQGVLS